MNKLLYIFTLLSICINAQSVNLRILDYSTNLSIDDADVYFSQSRKNFITDLDGRVVVNLKDVNATDELIVSKKDYQDARIKVSNLKSDLTIKLEKISEIELQETIVTNLRAEDILQKVIDNYENNFKVDKYYFLATVKQSVIEDTNKDYIDVNLQFKFKNKDLKIKSTGKVNSRYTEGKLKYKVNINTVDYLKNLYLFDGLKEMHESTLNQRYLASKVVSAKYADKPMYEVYLNKTEDQQIYLLIDKSTFSLVEFKSNFIKNKSINLDIKSNEVSIKFRPYGDSWILKESTVFMDTSFKHDSSPTINLDYKLNTYDFSTNPFPEFKKSVREEDDIRRSFK